ncbi:TrbI/VirB10 family protein [Phenylobacterium sp.]|jgi:type IV secretion system protein VirB10|uniref:TrbI/VirB10 family protein n=1 Tax=Phenylobacterium sp. TaxID=1871053 RepID=UPI002E353BB5|nr:TrbI/VirB10 family protein [Phenylobacterium sp.]HEX2560191.1 TrbI/VirB10 family protein [Phenylobacterium sp.]
MTPTFDHDPRFVAANPDAPAATEDTGPLVGGERSGLSPWATAAIFAVLALVLFLWLNGRRTEAAETPPAARSLGAPQAGAAPSLALPPPGVRPAQPGAFSDLPATALTAEPAGPSAPVAAAQPSYPAPAAPAVDPGQRRRAPALVVDLGGGGAERMILAQATTTPAGPGAVIAAAAGPAAGDAADAGPQLNDSEQFAQRVGGQEPERARATPMRNPSALVPQGAMIPGVLETAINSDLPGYTRAIVSRDVLSFDGSQVLIPRGSRLIGQYKSAVSLGQSRAFIIWTRAIRPDGVSIQLGSPGTDALGRGGLDGDVDRHFFRRFAGSILLSVLNAGVAAIGSQPSTQISIGSPGAASGLASSALQGENISPTIKVAQGEAIRIFVARDLDFSGVDAVR